MKDVLKPIQYIVIGSNNFWYAITNSKKEAKAITKRILEDKSDKESNFYADPESNNRPFRPEEIYIYQAQKLITIIK